MTCCQVLPEDYYMKNLGVSFCDTSPTDNEKSTGILLACASILPQLRLIESVVYMMLSFWPDDLGSHYSSLGATTLYEVWPAQRFSSMFIYP